MDSLQQQRVSVIGAARSGVAVARLLASHGAHVFVSDRQAEATIAQAVAELRGAGIETETGGHSPRVFECSLMVISPGVPSDAPVVRDAQQRGIRVVSELEVGSWFCPAPIIAITGSNGKTTTTTLVGRVLGDAKKEHVVAGNLGTAFSSVVLDLAETHTVVLEVSSFQLDHTERFRPSIAALLNITPDHMDRYGHSMERYAASKARIFRNQTKNDVLVYNADDEWTRRVVANARCRTVAFSIQRALDEGAFVERDELVIRMGGATVSVIPTEQISIRGAHNLANAMAAALIGQLSGVSAASMRATLRNFKGVEHRLEFVREVDGVRYVNDSKATNVDSVWYALQSFREPIVVLLGGRDKGNDYARLTELVRAHVRSIVAIGESAGTVEAAFRDVVPIRHAASMEEAVTVARSVAHRGDVVLLSPACASFDWFRNYEHRGEVFKQLVEAL